MKISMKLILNSKIIFYSNWVVKNHRTIKFIFCSFTSSIIYIYTVAVVRLEGFRSRTWIGILFCMNKYSHRKNERSFISDVHFFCEKRNWACVAFSNGKKKVITRGRKNFLITWWTSSMNEPQENFFFYIYFRPNRFSSYGTASCLKMRTEWREHANHHEYLTNIFLSSLLLYCFFFFVCWSAILNFHINDTRMLHLVTIHQYCHHQVCW